MFGFKIIRVKPKCDCDGLTVDDVTNAIVEHVVKQYNEIFEKVLDRIEAIEEKFGIAARKSLDGGHVEKQTPDLADAIAAALRHTKGAPLR